MFVEQTHNIDTQMRDGEKPMRFTDTRLDEQERGVSLKMVPMSLVMEGTSGKSYLMNLIDTPGGSLIHPMPPTNTSPAHEPLNCDPQDGAHEPCHGGHLRQVSPHELHRYARCALDVHSPSSGFRMLSPRPGKRIHSTAAMCAFIQQFF